MFILAKPIKYLNVLYTHYTENDQIVLDMRHNVLNLQIYNTKI